MAKQEKHQQTVAGTANAEVQQSNGGKAQEETSLVTTQQGGELSPLEQMYADDAGAGLRNMGANDFAVPFLTILQKGSPQVSRANAKYVKNAEQGMIMDTTSQEVYSGETGILVVPCGYSKMVVEWKPRDSGGGFVAQHRPNDPILAKCSRNERSQLIHPDTGNVMIDTAYHFVIFLREDGTSAWAVVSMYSTQLKKSRIWNTQMRSLVIKAAGRSFNPPSYSHKYRLTTIGEAKDTYDWFGWKITSEGRVEDLELYKTAHEFARQVEEGEVRITAPPADVQPEKEEEVPF